MMKCEIKKLSDVGKIYTGKTPKTSDKSNFDGNIPFATPSDLHGKIIEDTNRHISEKAMKSLAYVREGSTLVGCIGDVGKVGFASVPMTFNQQINAIEWNNKIIYDKYGFYTLLYMTNILKKKAVSSVVPILNKTNFSKIQIPIPPLTEQKRISTLLEKIDYVLTLRQQAILKLDVLEKSLFENIFGDPVSNNKNWPTEKLGLLTIKLGSGATPLGGSDSYKSKGISLIRSLNVQDGLFKFKNLVFIDDDQALRLSNVEVKKNDVLLNITGASVARTCIVPESILPARVNQHVMIIRPKNILDSIFLGYLLLNSNIKRKLLSIAGSGATREAITKKAMENFEIIVPPMKLQNEFKNNFKNLQNLKKNMIIYQNKINDLSLSLKYKLFPPNQNE